MNCGSLVIVMPVYEDWPALDALLPALDRALHAAGRTARVLLVDDGSNTPLHLPALQVGFVALHNVECLALRRNLGHQRALSIGLTYVHEHIHADAVVVMDADGQDRPEDVPRLVHALEQAPAPPPVVFAARRRRAESPGFRIAYHTFRLVHRLLVGLPVQTGNFSVVPRAQLERLVVVSELWNHYSAAVFHARLPTRLVPTARAPRLAGDAHMSLVALVTHGLSAISIYSATVGVRLLLATGALLGVVAVCWLVLLLTAPGGAAVWIAGLGAVLLTQLLLVAFGLVVFILGGRERLAFVPLRDYHYFVRQHETLYERGS